MKILFNKGNTYDFLDQEYRIQVYEERVNSLSERLSGFDFPEKSKISLDADHPWAAIIQSLNDAESQLALAKDERAIAIRSVEARKMGPMSGITKLIKLESQ